MTSASWSMEPYRWAWVLLSLFVMVASGWSSRMLDSSWWSKFPSPKEAAEVFSLHGPEFFVHIIPSILCLFVGPFQFLKIVRMRNMPAHRWTGRVYVICVVIAAITGLQLSFSSLGGNVGHAGFGLLSVIWFITVILAYRSIMTKQILSHRNWMIRNFSLTFFGVTMNVYILAASFVRKYAFGFEEGVEGWQYALISWASWVPNLVVAEYHIRVNLAPPAVNNTAEPLKDSIPPSHPDVIVVTPEKSAKKTHKLSLDIASRRYSSVRPEVP